MLALLAPAASAHPGPRVDAPPITPGCDPIGTAACLLPWPNDYFTRPAWSATGRRLNLLPTATPRNKNGVAIEPADYNLSDGFSPGQTIVVKVPGLDTPEAFAKTGPVPVTDLARTYDRRAPVVVINARTHRRHLIWAELDSNGVTPETTGLLIHPGVNWREGQRYIVAMRSLKDGAGKPIEPGRAFELY